MNFGTRLKELRKSMNETQTQFGEAIGLTKRTIINYETNRCKPKDIEIYSRIAEHCKVDLNTLLSEEEIFMYKVRSNYCYKVDDDIQNLLNNMVGLFAGGELPYEDMEAVIETLQQTYCMIKEENKKKYSTKKEQEK